jgi:hypothetical protein
VFRELAIVDAILGGQRDAAELAKLRHYRIKAGPETIRKSWAGNWRHEHLKQSRMDPGHEPLPPDQKKRRRNNRDTKSGFNLRWKCTNCSQST